MNLLSTLLPGLDIEKAMDDANHLAARVQEGLAKIVSEQRKQTFLLERLVELQEKAHGQGND